MIAISRAISVLTAHGLISVHDVKGHAATMGSAMQGTAQRVRTFMAMRSAVNWQPKWYLSSSSFHLMSASYTASASSFHGAAKTSTERALVAT